MHPPQSSLFLRGQSYITVWRFSISITHNKFRALLTALDVFPRTQEFSYFIRWSLLNHFYLMKSFKKQTGSSTGRGKGFFTGGFCFLVIGQTASWFAGNPPNIPLWNFSSEPFSFSRWENSNLLPFCAEQLCRRSTVRPPHDSPLHLCLHWYFWIPLPLIIICLPLSSWLNLWLFLNPLLILQNLAKILYLLRYRLLCPYGFKPSFFLYCHLRGILQGKGDAVHHH